MPDKLIDALVLKSNKKISVFVLAQSPMIIKGVFTFKYNDFNILSRDSVQIEPPDRLFILGTSSKGITKDTYTFDSSNNLEAYLRKLKETLEYINNKQFTETEILELNMGRKTQGRFAKAVAVDIAGEIPTFNPSFSGIFTTTATTGIVTDNSDAIAHSAEVIRRIRLESRTLELRQRREQLMEEQENNPDADEEDFDDAFAEIEQELHELEGNEINEEDINEI